jgi:hypothetical protein
MKNDKKTNLSEDHLRRILYRNDYVIGESPRYRPLVSDGEEFDNVPVLTNEAGEQEDAEIPGGGTTPTEPSNDQPMGMEDAPVPEYAETGETAAGGMPPVGGEEDPTVSTDPMGMGAGMSTPPINDIQNDIIKHNIEAMKGIHGELKSLEDSVNSLNSQLSKLNADVEEVREPTNSEKLMSKKNVSYPYYFNLNDFWKGNWFNEKRDDVMEKGIRELPDGSFVADFDDLPEISKIDVQSSFNDMV